MSVAPVVKIPSSKHSGVSGMTTQLFTQHSGECPLRGGYAISLTNWAKTPTSAGGPWASWPSFVDPQARVRMVAWPNTAWTQGNANPYAVGLECAGYAHFTPAQWLTPEGLKQLENLAQEWAYYWQLEASVGNKIPFRWLTTPEVRAVMAGNRSIKGFCTHAQIDPTSRTDPGPNFPYKQLLTRIEQIVTGTSAAGEIKKDWFAEMDEKTFDEKLAANNEKLIQDLLRYNGTSRTDRSLYALIIDAGLHSYGNKQLLVNIWGVVSNIGRTVWGYRRKNEKKDASAYLAEVREATVGPIEFEETITTEEPPPAAPTEGEVNGT